MTSIIRADNISTVAGTGTIAVQAGNTLDASAGFTAPAGHVIQTVHYNMTSEIVVSDTAGAATVFGGCTITPRNASSKILIVMNHNAMAVGITSTGSFGERLLRDSTNIYSKGEVWYFTGTTQQFEAWSFMYYDEPNTTNQVQYDYQILTYETRGRVNYNRGGGHARMILMEIAG